MTKRGRLILMICAGLALVLVLFGCLVFNGVIQLNRPSRERYPVRGVDVSHYQGAIDWETLSAQDVAFAYIKATEGSTHTDERFAENWRSAQQTGLRVGAYHFFSLDSPGAAQAEHFCAVVEIADNMLPPVADVEPYGTHKKLGAEERDILARELGNYIAAITDAYGTAPVIYTTLDWYPFIREVFPQCDIWIRSVYFKPSNDIDWTFWQYSNRAALSGYSGEERFIDMNVFRGTKEDFAHYPK